MHSSSSKRIVTTPVVVPQVLYADSNDAATPLTTMVTLMNPYNGDPTATIVESLMVLTDDAGVPTLTLAKYVTTATDLMNGAPTTTQTFYLTAPGVPYRRQRTFTSYPKDSETERARPLSSEGEYFLGAFLPVLLAVVFVAIPVQIINANVKRAIPFKMLSRNRNHPCSSTSARDSLCLSLEGFQGPVASFRIFFRLREPAGALGDLLTWCSGLLVAVSRDVLGVRVSATCNNLGSDVIEKCFLYLAMQDRAARAAEALLVIMMLLLVYLGWVFRQWKVPSGALPAEPWSQASLATLLMPTSVMIDTPVDGKRHIGQKEIARILQGYTFSLKPFPSGEVGIAVQDAPEKTTPSRQTDGQRGGGKMSVDPKYNTSPQAQKKSSKTGTLPHQVSSKLRYSIINATALTLHVGLVILILYYELTILNTPFERFMDSDTFGVHFLFTGTGVLMTVFWDSLFLHVARLTPYRRLSRRPRTANDSILREPPTNVFTGLWTAVRQRDFPSSVVALAGVLSKFMPIVLANVPFSNTVTWRSHEACTWISVGVLWFMIFVLAGSLVVKLPAMPVDPGTIAGSMYYICDSRMLEDVAGLKASEGLRAGAETTLTRQKAVAGSRRYVFGKSVGVWGKTRIAVDYAREEPEP
ncbi:hypothetical protein QBC35DRAFT_375997 [Podospora australis]|uniref:Uncharacterized protein n=1 Tax=Podospora australis TaxID=1536484 RepID=A0AAN7ALQ1_9PEZI|nr:hypothetical protein QBC35DRAFT_375997 [Podospora australis]